MKDAIRQYLTDNRATSDAGDFSDDESLLDAGIIDSVSMMDIITFLESTYGITVDEDDMTPENFDSVDAIATYVSQKREA